jgi:hypothetical protein
MPQGNDTDGFEKRPVTEWAFWGNCNRQSAAGQKVSVANGEAFLYSSIVFADSNIVGIVAGTCIEVRDTNGQVLLTGEVKSFDKNSKHTRIWV